MSSAISGSLNLSRAQSQIPISSSGAASNIQNFSTYDAVELIGYVFVDGSSADYRASVKLSIVKNGAGSYEVAASDIAGDDYLGSPIVSFSMSGSLLQATLDSALVAAQSPSESYIRYALSAPAVGGQDNISIDASKIVSGTLDSGVLPLATGSSAGAIPFYEEGTWTPSATSFVNCTQNTGFSISGATYVRVGNLVMAYIAAVSSVTISSTGTTGVNISTEGLPGVVNSTVTSGAGLWSRTSPTLYQSTGSILSASASSTDIAVRFWAEGTGSFIIVNIGFNYLIS